MLLTHPQSLSALVIVINILYHILVHVFVHVHVFCTCIGYNTKTILNLSPDQVSIKTGLSSKFIIFSDVIIHVFQHISLTTVLTSTLCHLLCDNISKRLPQLYLSLWMRLNSIILQR